VRRHTWSEHPQAREDLFAAADRLPPDLAEQLIRRSESAVEDILGGPASWPPVPYWNGSVILRWRTVRPFRIHVVYYLAGDEVRVIAYAHEAREPGYWQHRVVE